jgi:ribosomal protein L12E/L44/L45/RPP1/RPP2
MRPFEPLPWENLSDTARALLPKDATPATRLAAARSAVPMGTRDLVSVLYHLAADGDRRIRAAARRSLGALPTELLGPILAERLAAEILNWFAHRTLPDPRLYEVIALNRAAADETIAYLAERRSEEPLLTIIANNQERMLRSTALLEALLNNDATPLAVTERVRAFVEMMTGLPIEEYLAQQAAKTAVAAEAEEEEAAAGGPPGVEDELERAAQEELERTSVDAPDQPVDEVPPDFDINKLVHEVFQPDSDFATTFIVDPEVDLSARQRLSLVNKIRKMPVIDKMRLALKGNIEARQILIKSANKLIQECVLRNPRMTIEEVIKISKDKTMREELIRVVTLNKEWTKNYQVVHQLCWNPKTPITVALKYLSRLNVRDVQQIAKSKQVPGILAVQARKVAADKLKNR